MPEELPPSEIGFVSVMWISGVDFSVIYELKVFHFPSKSNLTEGIISTTQEVVTINPPYGSQTQVALQPK